MRDSAPPEKVLKKSSTPPCVVENSFSIIRGSMPGSGTKDSRRKTINAPMVNHSRFFRSVALAKFARLILAAICSAADAMVDQGPDDEWVPSAAAMASYSEQHRLV